MQRNAGANCRTGETPQSPHSCDGTVVLQIVLFHDLADAEDAAIIAAEEAAIIVAEAAAEEAAAAAEAAAEAGEEPEEIAEPEEAAPPPVESESDGDEPEDEDEAWLQLVRTDSFPTRASYYVFIWFRVLACTGQ